MDGFERVETVELAGERSVLLEFSRRWPKYVVAWSIRRQVGESDFPVAAGQVESMPPKGDRSLDDMWNELRDQALDEANRAAPEESGSPARSRSFIDRILGRE